MEPIKPEVWMRGPVEGIPPLLQPVAHALLQAREEVQHLLENFDDEFLWTKPAGSASVGFHLQHLTGILDRLFTYAHGEQLSPNQLLRLKSEGVANVGLRSTELVRLFSGQIDQALRQLSQTAESSLAEPRGIGRKQIPTTVIGLLFHAAEHAMRHTGQLLVTVRVIRPA